MNKEYRILAINPGSTSTKIAVFDNETKLFGTTIEHDANELASFAEISDQHEYRRNMVINAVKENGFHLNSMDAFVGRGGGLVSCEGGTYAVEGLLLEHARTNFTAKHPATLGSVIAYELAQEYAAKAYTVNPPTVDEFEPLAYVSGLKDAPRKSSFHALNQKEVALRAARAIGKQYEEANFVVAHIGGGISVTAHKKGRAVDTTDIINGDGCLTPTRSGAIAAVDIVELCFSGKYTKREMYDKLTKSGGFVDHLGTSDVLEVKRRIANGDEYAKIIYEGMIYQIGKNIGAYAAVLHGEVDAIVLTGGIARSEDLVEKIRQMVGYIAPVMVYPGEFEMEALAYGALRVLRGEEHLKTYTGIPVWSGFGKEH